MEAGCGLGGGGVEWHCDGKENQRARFYTTEKKTCKDRADSLRCVGVRVCCLPVSVNAISVCRRKGTECMSAFHLQYCMWWSPGLCVCVCLCARVRAVVCTHYTVCVLLVNSGLAATDFRLGQL